MIDYPDWVWKLPKTPISKTATNLMSDFLLRTSFWWAVTIDRMPLEFAGATFFKVNLRRSQEIMSELELAGGPQKWFESRVKDGLISGKIGRGRSTAESRLADHFWILVAGGRECIDDIRVKAFGGTFIAEYRTSYKGIGALNQEILDYMVLKQYTSEKASVKSNKRTRA